MRQRAATESGFGLDDGLRWWAAANNFRRWLANGLQRWFADLLQRRLGSSDLLERRFRVACCIADGMGRGLPNLLQRWGPALPDRLHWRPVLSATVCRELGQGGCRIGLGVRGLNWFIVIEENQLIVVCLHCYNRSCSGHSRDNWFCSHDGFGCCQTWLGCCR
jgi:hypothetical protein